MDIRKYVNKLYFVYTVFKFISCVSVLINLQEDILSVFGIAVLVYTSVEPWEFVFLGRILVKRLDTEDPGIQRHWRLIEIVRHLSLPAIAIDYFARYIQEESQYAVFVGFITAIGFIKLTMYAVNCIPSHCQSAPAVPKKHSFFKELTDNKGLEVCPICLDEFNFDKKFGALKCKHVFHYDCISEWLQDHYNCPQCRELVI